MDFGTGKAWENFRGPIIMRPGWMQEAAKAEESEDGLE